MYHRVYFSEKTNIILIYFLLYFRANLELDAIRKQNEAETVKLHAMIKKAEVKSNSLAELVEQKTKENKELAKILDELIARVGHGNSE